MSEQSWSEKIHGYSTAASGDACPPSPFRCADLPERDRLTGGIAYARCPASLPRRLRDLAEIAVLSERTLASGTADTPTKGSVLRFIAQALRGIADEVAPEWPVVRPGCPRTPGSEPNPANDQADPETGRVASFSPAKAVER